MFMAMERSGYDWMPVQYGHQLRGGAACVRTRGAITIGAFNAINWTMKDYECVDQPLVFCVAKTGIEKSQLLGSQDVSGARHIQTNENGISIYKTVIRIF